MRYELTEPVLNRLGQILVERIKREIKKKQFPYGRPTIKGKSDKYATGDLYNSINYKVVRPQGGGLLGTAPALQFDFGDTLPGKNYTLFDVVNFGVGKNKARPPIKNILNWIQIRGIRPRDKSGRFLPNTDENKLRLAYAIKTNIYRYGIRPANLIDKGYKNVSELFERPPQYLQAEINQLYEAIGQDVQNIFQNIIEE